MSRRRSVSTLVSSAGLWATLLLTPGALRAQAVGIVHDAPSCLLANQYPRLDACVVATAEVARVRINFRAAGTEDWYFVEMSPEGGCYAGVLPKPSAATKKIEYYIDAADKQLTEGRSADFAPIVSEDCGNLAAAGVVSSATVAVGGAAGAPAVPAGFAPLGVVAGAPAPAAGAAVATTGEGVASGAGEAVTGAGSGSSGTASGAPAGTGAGTGGGAAAGGAAVAAGGLSTAAIVGIAAGGVALAGVGVAAAGGGGDDSNDSHSSSQPQQDPRAVDNDGDGFSENQGDCDDANHNVNPNGTLVFSGARFEPAVVACPVGADGQALDLGAAVNVSNNSCRTATISSATINITITAVENTNDTVGETYPLEGLPFAPNSVGAGGFTTLRVTTQAGNCHNPAGGDQGAVEFGGTLLLETSAGSFTLPLQNSYHVDFPVSGLFPSAPGAHKGVLR